jgi:hypothetical protein
MCATHDAVCGAMLFQEFEDIFLMPLRALVPKDEPKQIGSVSDMISLVIEPLAQC